jgi:ABC-type branched-subunit amino acid transport system permease subunit
MGILLPKCFTLSNERVKPTVQRHTSISILDLEVLSMWNCVSDCLSAIPWWAWVALTAIGALFGLITGIVSILTAGATLALVPLLLAAGSGILSAYFSTILNCVTQCMRR